MYGAKYRWVQGPWISMLKKIMGVRLTWGTVPDIINSGQGT
ncbi:MAG: hypothetical protein AB4352_10650 [Hormoscilla sp.]